MKSAKESASFCLRVRGDFACFTRPEMKVERVSYDVITPSAVRAIFEAICWKPAIRWIPEKTEVLRPVKWLSLRRNEVGTTAKQPSKEIMAGGGGEELGIYVEEERQQRAGLFLRDVEYRIYARFAMTPKAEGGDNIGKFSDMFCRRAKKGQCFNQPYLGCREFSADFVLVEDMQADKKQHPAVADTRDLGFMLYDIDFSRDMTPLMFRAEMKNGVIIIPSPESKEIYGKS